MEENTPNKQHTTNYKETRAAKTLQKHHNMDPDIDPKTSPKSSLCVFSRVQEVSQHKLNISTIF